MSCCLSFLNKFFRKSNQSLTSSDHNLLQSEILDQNLNQQKKTIRDFEIKVQYYHNQQNTFFLVQEILTGKTYSLKQTQKKNIKQINQRELIQNEIIILKKIQNPFINQIHYSFQDHQQLFTIQEFKIGGDFSNLLEAQHRFSEERAKFYLVEIIIALEALHNKQIIYRNLKFEHILLGADGHISLIDFSAASTQQDFPQFQSLLKKSYYMAPEILKGESHEKSVDWWALGVIMYQMLTGYFPFDGQGVDLYKQIISANVLPNEILSKSAKDLISNLLQKEVKSLYQPSERLGFSIRDSYDIKTHPFFENIDWDCAYYKEMDPEFLPRVENEYDLKYFDQNQLYHMNQDDNDKIKMSVDLSQQQSYLSNFTLNIEMSQKESSQMVTYED